MKNLLILLTLSINLVLFSERGNATNYYFSNSGSDANSGTSSSSPFQTISKFNSLNLQPGDHVYFNRGDAFYGAMTISHSGNSGSPIVIDAYGSGADPVITGLSTISSWTSLGNNLWQSSSAASTLSSLNMVVTSGNFQAIGRWPKITNANKGYLTYQSGSSGSITSNALGGAASFTGGQVAIRKNHWILDVGTITAQTSTTVTFSGGSSYSPTGGYGFFFQNHKNACTQQGEWWYDASSKKLGIYSSSTPSGVQVANVDVLVNLNSNSYLTFQNIVFSGSNSKTVSTTGGNHVAFNSCSFYFAGADCFNTAASSNNVSIIDCTADWTNDNFIWANASQNWTITGNTINHTGYTPGMGSSGDGKYNAIYDVSTGSVIQHNTIKNSGYCGIVFRSTGGAGGGINVSYNLIDTYCISKDDGGGIYTWQGGNYSIAQRTIDHNIILNGIGVPEGTNIGSYSSAHGIYMDNLTSDVTITNNSGANIGAAGLYLHAGSRITANSNTFYNCAVNSFYGQLLIKEETNETARNNTLQNNIYVARANNVFVAYFQAGASDDLSQFGNLDNNYYCRPINESSNTIQIYNGSAYQSINLAGWQSHTGLDLHSKKTPVAVSDASKIRFEYNASTSSKTINLGATYMDVTGKNYAGSVTLAPYTSAVLIYSSGTIANQSPVANAGTDQNFFLPTNSTTLNGSGTDADGTITSYQWTKISGPSQYNIASPSQAKTTISNLIEGVYQFVLTVTDNQGATGTDTVSVTVNASSNQFPVANAGLNINITLPVNSATLSGSGSDPDGTIASYQWTKISGPSQYTIVSIAQAVTVVTNLVQGVYQFELKVTDNSGATATDDVLVTVNAAAPNQSPTANAGSDINITLPTNSATLSGSGSDPDGTIASYQWTKISGPSQYNIVSSTQAKTTVNNLAQGIYQFELKVTDNSGVTATDDVQVTVNAAPPNQSPTANAGIDINITLPTNSVTLSGSGSDPDGTIASYQWRKISGPSQYNIVSSTQAKTTVNNLAQGIYQFELKVTDNSGATGTDTATVTVNAAPNQAPVADAGSDINIMLPANSIKLLGSGTDPDGTIVSYQWTKTSGPSQYNIVSPSQAQTTVNNLVEGVYTFELKVTDNSSATATSNVRVNVNAAPINEPPTADAGPDINIILPVNSVSLNGSGNDPDGTIASYQWSKISGPSQYSIVSSRKAQVTVRSLVQGVYLFELQVTDNSGVIARDTVQVSVNAAPINQPPIANAGLDINITLPVNSAILKGSGSDPDGTIVSYQWSKISGPSQYNIVSSTQAQTTVNNLVQGVYLFVLKVTDNAGAISRDTVQVSINAAPINQSPTADAGPDISITLPTNSVTLNGSGNDPDGTIVSYQWTKTSGPSQYSIVSPTHAQTTINNLVEGVYTFELSVIDNQGATGKNSVIVTVNAAPNQPPIADAGPDITITLPLNSVTLNGSGDDPDGTIVSYQWTKTSGPSQYSIVSPTHAQTTINNLVEGVYTFELSVIDNQGATGKNSVIVTVNAAPNQPPIADAGPDITITLPLNSVTLNGSGDDPDGTIVSYQWTKTSGPSQYNIVSSTKAQTTITNLAHGVYTFELKVTDNAGAVGISVVTVTVNTAPNEPPTADAGSNINITLPINSITLNGSGNDPDGMILFYLWTKISGPDQYNIRSSNRSRSTVSNLVEGVYLFELKVTDNSGATAADTVQVTVNAAVQIQNQLPSANAGPDVAITLPVNSVTLNGSGSDPDGTIASYQWTMLAGPDQYNVVSPVQASTAVNNLVEGTYTLELEVTDNSGATAADTVHITVNAAPVPNQSPIANAGSNINITLPTNSVTLSGSGSDPDGTIASYRWTKISGPSQYNITSFNKSQTTIYNLVQGVYTFELRVTDNLGATGRDTIQITVNAAAPNQSPTANAGPDINITLPVNSVTLNGSGNDPDGTIASYQWTKVSGPSQYIIVSSSKAKTTINNLVQGVYKFELKVTDDSSATGKDTIQVTVNAAAQPQNQPPTANAGSNINITLPLDSVTVNGSGKDQDGTIASYQWTKISGPSSYNIVSPSKAKTIINSLVKGTYKFELKVTDNTGATGTDTIQVIVNTAVQTENQAPVANAGDDINITLPANSAILSGSGVDSDGTIASYHWAEVSGPSGFTMPSSNDAQITVSDLVAGEYEFELKVTDNLGATGRDTVKITVNEKLKSTAKIFPNPATNQINIKIHSATKTDRTSIRIYDSKGLLVYQESFANGQQTMIKQVDVSKLTNGVYYVEMNVDANKIMTLMFVKE